eukprot:46325-Chlamydomonas_euryale.AAC.1
MPRRRRSSAPTAPSARLKDCTAPSVLPDASATQTAAPVPGTAWKSPRPLPPYVASASDAKRVHASGLSGGCARDSV